MDSKIYELKCLLDKLTDKDIEKVSVFIAGMRVGKRIGKSTVKTGAANKSCSTYCLSVKTKHDFTPT